MALTCLVGAENYVFM